MKQLIITEWVTIDGVFDADSMAHWFMPYDGLARQEVIKSNILNCDALLLGRKTYEMQAPYWSQMKHNEFGIADKLNSVRKYTVSATLQAADWGATTIIRNDVVAAVRELKQQPGGPILVFGSGELAQTLIAGDLIDRYQFIVHPVVMGKGKRFFRETALPSGLRLTSADRLDHGVVLLNYERAV